MKRQPRDSKEGIFAGGMGFDCLYQGLMVTALTLLAYFLGTNQLGIQLATGTPEIIHQNGMTMAFLTLSMSEIFHSFNMRSRRLSIAKMGSINWYLVGAMVLSLVLSTAVIYVPFLSNAFKFAHISLTEYGLSLLLAVMTIPIVEIVKAIQRAMKK